MQERKDPKPTYRAEDVRQGEVILKRPWQRALFAVGLLGGMLWAVLMAVFFQTSP